MVVWCEPYLSTVQLSIDIFMAAITAYVSSQTTRQARFYYVVLLECNMSEKCHRQPVHIGDDIWFGHNIFPCRDWAYHYCTAMDFSLMISADTYYK